MPTCRTKTSDRTKANDRTQANNRPYSRSFSGAYRFKNGAIGVLNGSSDYDLDTFTLRVVAKLREPQATPGKLFGMQNNHWYFSFWSNGRILFLYRNGSGAQTIAATSNFAVNDHYEVWREYLLRVNTNGSNVDVDMFIQGDQVLDYSDSNGFDSNFNQPSTVIGQSIVNTDIAYIEMIDSAVTDEQVQDLLKVKSCSEIGITPVDNWDFSEGSGTTIGGLLNDFTLTNNGDWNISYPVARPPCT